MPTIYVLERERERERERAYISKTILVLHQQSQCSILKKLKIKAFNARQLQCGRQTNIKNINIIKMKEINILAK